MATTIVSTTRRCTKCGIEYPLTSEHFYKTGNSNHFRKSCKHCKYAYDNALRQTPEHKERRKIWDEKYNKSPKGKSFQKKRTSSPEYMEYRRTMSKRPKYRELAIKHQHTRRARKKNSGGVYTNTDIQIMLQSQKNQCWWCGELLNGYFEVDHRIALARGGSNDVGNLCLSCMHCNRTKSDKMPWEFNGRLL